MTQELAWILGGGLAMSAIALVGGLTLILPEARLRQILLPLVALSAGTLLGGALFHLVPAAIEHSGNKLKIYLWILAGFAAFFGLEQFLNWRHSHEIERQHEPLTYLILAADALHNFVGGLAVAGAFLIDIRLGISAWIAAAAHEIPQELGDFAVLVHGGWKPASALLLNLLSALTFLLGGIAAYKSARVVDVSFLLPSQPETSSTSPPRTSSRR
ncbi:MAG: ZIP family metal transporter [Bryobacteraceae bacterium]|nr:ZIP family metal transporter [Bryobacteraceae bacterium]